MKYDQNIRDHNIQPHLDIENDVQNKKNGLFTFILRVNNGNIVDYVVMEYKNARDYFRLKKVVIQEYTVARTGGIGGGQDPIRPDNVQRTVEGWGSSDADD